MEEYVAELLKPTALNHEAQAILLEDVDKVFNDEDRAMLEEEPTLDELKKEIWRGNEMAAPGTENNSLVL